MNKEFNLSEKIINASEEKTINAKIYGEIIPLKDVKEFIKRLKEMINDEDFHDIPKQTISLRYLHQIIDKLAGNKLVKENKEDE